VSNGFSASTSQVLLITPPLCSAPGDPKIARVQVA
jgi:hypothetical protein